jgi:flagellin-like protein
MSRKGVSPIVATVLLIVIVIILAAIIFIWAKGFLSESAVKGDRVVERSCENVKFEVAIAHEAQECDDDMGGYYSSIDINNIGNVPIYGAQILQFIDNEGSVDEIFNGAFEKGTITIGKSSFVCLGSLGRKVSPGDKFRVIPKLLAEKGDRRIAYTCPEKDGINVVYN